MDIRNLLCKDKEDGIDYYPTSPSSWSCVSSMSEPPKVKKHHHRTPWTASEDFLLEKGYLQGLSWAMISAKYLPHRSRGCCWGRFKTLQTKSTERKTWTESEDRILLTAVKKHHHLFKRAWRTVAVDLNERDWKECELRFSRISTILSHKRQLSN